MRDLHIEVIQEKCIKCGKCIKICPAHIFKKEEETGEVKPYHIETCIRCGHCVAVCPTNAIAHSDFPLDKIHPISASDLPTPEQVLNLYKARRSNRAFTSKPIPEDLLEQILEAAHRAPTASNMQEVEFTLITDLEVLKKVSEYTINIFSGVAKRLENPFIKPVLKPILSDVYKLLPSFNRLINEYNKGNDLILRKATALLFIHTPKESRFGCEDANLAYQNGSLMAYSLGVAHFYTGFVCAAIKQDKKRTIQELLGIKGYIHAGMALAMPSFHYPNYIDREDIKVNRI